MESLRSIKGHGEHKREVEKVIGIMERRAVRRDQWRVIQHYALQRNREKERRKDAETNKESLNSGELRRDEQSNGGPRRPEKRSREKSKK